VKLGKNAKIVTQDETWYFQYGPKSKQWSLQWNQPTFPWPKKA